jgi:hypothetical protein
MEGIKYICWYCVSKRKKNPLFDNLMDQFWMAKEETPGNGYYDRNWSIINVKCRKPDLTWSLIPA